MTFGLKQKHNAMKQLWLVGFWIFSLSASAQWSVDIQGGSSKQDYQNWILRGTIQLSERTTVSIESKNSDYRYRFIDARRVERGYSGQLSLSLAYRLHETEHLRLEGFLKPGIRYINFNEDDPQPFEFYSFSDSYALTFQPGLIVSIKSTDKLWLHTGINLFTSFQISPATLYEQFPSSLLLAGFSQQLGEQWVLFSNNMAGPASGASGDTEKFYWETNLGLRWCFGKPSLVTAY